MILPLMHQCGVQLTPPLVVEVRAKDSVCDVYTRIKESGPYTNSNLNNTFFLIALINSST